MQKFASAIFVFVICSIGPATAQNGPNENVWTMMPGTSSSMVAEDEVWKFVGMAGHSWPDGRQATLTMWRSNTSDQYIRCVDYFDSSMRQTGGACYRP